MYSLLEQKKSKEAAKKATKKQNIGIPAHLQEKFETKYGVSINDVHIYYNSTKPAKLGALAYTQGTSVHIGPGNDKYLQNELGHVIQQKFLRISPTKIINGYPVNDDPLLEKAADHPEGIHTDFHREADSGGNVLQLTTAYVSYIIDDTLLRNGANHSVGLGGEGGVSHAEQLAWGEKHSDITTQFCPRMPI